MSKKFFVGFLTAAQLATLHSAGHTVEAFAMSEPAKLVATLASSSIGATVRADVIAMRDQNLSGTQKFGKVLANTLPLVLHYAADPGTLITDAEGIARSLVQEIYNDVVGAVVKASPAVANGGTGGDANASAQWEQEPVQTGATVVEGDPQEQGAAAETNIKTLAA